MSLHSLQKLLLSQSQSQSQSHISTDDQSVSKSWYRAPLFDSYSLVFVGRTLWREDRSVFCLGCWPVPAQSFSGPSPLGLATIFYCLRFETSLFVASYNLQGHGGGIWPHLHTGEQSRVEQSSSLLPATSQHDHSWHRAPLGPMAIYLFSVKTFVFFPFFCCSSFDKKEGVGLFYNWCSLTTPYSTRGHIKVGDIDILWRVTPLIPYFWYQLWRATPLKTHASNY
jgi:hypothetical protein